MTIYIEIDGVPVPARDIVWITRASCGCISGASFVNSHADSDADLILTPEQNDLDMETHPIVAQRYRDDGFVSIPVTEATWDTLSDDFRGACPHTPRYGRHVAHIPDGMVWATSDRWYRGRRTHMRHLVGDGQIMDYNADHAALCGSKPKRVLWSIDDNDIHDTVTCRRCERAADAKVSDPPAKVNA